MKKEGPMLQALTRRLAEAPAEFLAPPWRDGMGEVRVAAVVSDLLQDLGGALPPAQEIESAFDPEGKPDAWLNTVLVACWLLHDPWFASERGHAVQALEFLRSGLAELSALARPETLVTDPERREELSRRALAGLGLRPAGETEAQARDRLDSVDSVERRSVVEKSKAQQGRLKKLLEAMREKAAREAAAKATPE